MTEIELAPQMASSVPVWSWGVIILAALILAFFAAGVAGAVLLAGRRLRRVHVKRLASIAIAWGWLIPGFGIVAFVSLAATRHFREAIPARGDTARRTPVEFTSIVRTKVGELPPNEPALKARQMTSDTPAWAQLPEAEAPLSGKAPDRQGEKYRLAAGSGFNQITGSPGNLLAVSSQRFATLDEAERQVTEQVLTAVRRHFHEEFPDFGHWRVPVALVEKYAVRQSAYEVLDKDFGNGFTGKMYRAHVQLNFSPELRNALFASWKEGVVNQRLFVLAVLVGLATLMVGTIAAYFRLDDMSFGIYGRRLKLAAGAMITAGCLVALQFVL